MLLRVCHDGRWQEQKSEEERKEMKWELWIPCETKVGVFAFNRKYLYSLKWNLTFENSGTWKWKSHAEDFP